MTIGGRIPEGRGVAVLVVCFLAVTVPIETVYSWHVGLSSPYYLVKLTGWVFLVFGAAKFRSTRRDVGLVLLAVGWAWLSANFCRAVADRVSRMAAGQTLRLGAIEVWFAGGCLLVSLIALCWCVVLASRPGALAKPEH